MVIILPNFFLQKPVCRLLAVMGFLGFSGVILLISGCCSALNFYLFSNY